MVYPGVSATALIGEGGACQPKPREGEGELPLVTPAAALVFTRGRQPAPRFV
jgi:hypothetical protein